jgi:hypothetical protein
VSEQRPAGRADGRDALALVGVVVLCVGLALWSVALALVVLGVLCLLPAAVGAWRGR